MRGTHYCLRSISYDHIWDLLCSQPITHFNAAPTVCTNLVANTSARRLPRPVDVAVAASPPAATLLLAMERLNLRPVHMYGMTETYGPITKSYFLPSWDNLPEAQRYEQVARQGHGFLTSLPVRVIKTGTLGGTHGQHIDDKASVENQRHTHGSVVNDLVDVAKDGTEIGEIVFTGNICTRGYLKNPVATKELWQGGVLHSGDLAVWCEDGSVKIVDRKKDIIISGKH